MDQLRIHEAEMVNGVLNELKRKCILGINCEEKELSELFIQKRLRNAGEPGGLGAS